jgi:hypothetical protein
MQFRVETPASANEKYSVFSPSLFRKRASAPMCCPQVFCDGFDELSLLTDEKSHQVYDPFCGNGFGLSALALYRSPPIRTLYGSDIDGEAIMAARSNLQLTSQHGVQQFIDNNRGKFFETLSPKGCKEFVDLQRFLRQRALELPVWQRIFKANALNDCNNRNMEVPKSGISMLLTDPPYGNECSFSGIDTERQQMSPAELTKAALEACRSRLSDNAVAGIIFNGQLSSKKRIKTISDILAQAKGYDFLKAVMPESYIKTNRCLFVLRASAYDEV